jgi:hypothetical protein
VRIRVAIALAASTLTALAGMSSAPSATAARGLVTGFADALYLSPDAATRSASLSRSAQAGAGLARLHVIWSVVAPTRPANPADPADPAYRFTLLDAAVRNAAAARLDPVLTVSSAPAWAEGGGRPQSAPPGSWRPQPNDLSQFAAALARRYGGDFPGPGGSGLLPRVRFLQAWNEPNLNLYLTPQWEGKAPTAALLYRELLNAFYAGVKSVRPDDLVVTAGTAPFGDRPGGQRIRPLRFWRTVFCLRERKAKLKRAKCPQGGRAKLDVLAHHPINPVSKPTKAAKDRDDASSADMGRVRRVLRAAERFRTIEPPGHRPLWATEFWWETNPLDTQFGVSPARQARFIEQSLYLIWKGGGSAAINLQVSDAATHAPGQVNQSGVFLAGGSPKPSFTAFRFPLVAERLGSKSVRVWGKSPIAGTLLIQGARGASFRTIRSLQVGAGQVFSTRLRFRGKRRLRASIGGQTSLVWLQR